MNLADKTRNQLHVTSTNEQHERFEQYEEAWSNMSAVCEKDLFIEGFRLGMQVAVESLMKS